MTQKDRLEQIRKAVVMYIGSEGCSCCQDVEEHEKWSNVLGELLNIPKYDDDSGYNFYSVREEYMNGKLSGI